MQNVDLIRTTGLIYYYFRVKLIGEKFALKTPKILNAFGDLSLVRYCALKNVPEKFSSVMLGKGH